MELTAYLKGYTCTTARVGILEVLKDTRILLQLRAFYELSLQRHLEGY